MSLFQWFLPLLSTTVHEPSNLLASTYFSIKKIIVVNSKTTLNCLVVVCRNQHYTYLIQRCAPTFPHHLLLNLINLKCWQLQSTYGKRLKISKISK